MGETLAILAGAALGYWLASSRGQSIAVRVACGLGWVLLEAGLLAGWLAGWRWAGVDAAIGAAVGFAGPVLVLGSIAAAEWAIGAARAGHGRRLAAIGAALVVFAAGAWWLWPGAVQGPPETAQAAQAEAAQAVDCPCASGRICEGPRGGRYCITDAGGKRYQARQ